MKDKNWDFKYVTLTEQRVPQFAGYEFEQPARYGWLFKLFWLTLKHAKALRIKWNHTIKYDRIPMRSDKIDRYILDALKNSRQSFIDPSKQAILIGGCQYEELLSTPHILTALEMRSGLVACVDRVNYYGFPLIVVPHMSGIAIIPKELLK